MLIASKIARHILRLTVWRRAGILSAMPWWSYLLAVPVALWLAVLVFAIFFSARGEGVLVDDRGSYVPEPPPPPPRTRWRLRIERVPEQDGGRR